MKSSDDQPGTARIAIATGVPFGLCMGVWLGWTTSPAQGVVLGVVGGIAFGLSMVGVTRRAAKGRTGPPDGRPVLRVGGANHVVRANSIGGTLYLTEGGLHFVSHGMNLSEHTCSLALNDVVSVEAVSMLGLIPNGLKVRLRDGTTERFVVSGRRRWVAEIEAAVRGR